MYVIANRITVTGSTEDYEDIYRRGGEFMERQPGLIRHELVRSLRSPDVYFSLASWTDRESFERCAAQPVFQEIFGATKGMVDIDHHRCAVISIGEASSTAR
ncbi:antibiotic biosynthesis monooxygenase family protein [Streptomyces sp. NPDC021969]|uniref:antibiotic biosynthesis monooxygenase family protein n=1 Tax=unclassified Streptomyces TaxID=2593676 RepID=UPI0021FF92E5|nr:monooxygenase [Streptomyces sp.]